VNVQVVGEARTRELRRAVLRPQLRLSDVLPGDELSDAVHIAALDGDEVLGTCFIHPSPCPWRPGEPGWRLRQMATAPARQGTGVGSAVLAGAVTFVAAHGGGVLWLHAREVAVPFYARNGFAVHGERFIENRIPHREMWHNVPAAASRPSSDERYRVP
jgi:predicted GNAT family N-acyltransferase